MSKHKHTGPPTLPNIRSEYWTLFKTCTVKPEKLSDVKQIVTQITADRTRYENATATITMPWWFLALIHSLESGLKFNKHIHNGDALTRRTVHVPAGRPHANPRANPGHPPSSTNPYTWEESAEDAIRQKNLHTWTDWKVSAVLFKLEAYNGWGYRLYHPKVLSAYLWSFTNHYTKGKYASDGKWDANLVSQQAGAAAILRAMVDSGLVAFPLESDGRDYPDRLPEVRYA
jgi:lysozyme family protein